MLLIGSELSCGNRHTANNLPLVVAGDGSGTLRTGRAINYADHTAFARLLIAMAHGMGVKSTAFADETEPLQGILA